MEDGGLVYLIILAIIFLFNLFFGKKKKEQRPSAPQKDEDAGKTFEDVLQEIFEKKEQKPVQEKKETPASKMERVDYGDQKIPLPKKQMVKEYASDRFTRRTKLEKKKQSPIPIEKTEYQKFVEEQREKSRKKLAESKRLEVIETERAEAALVPEELFSIDEFNMKKAVIYQAILEKKWE